jgi:hypothetical protein
VIFAKEPWLSRTVLFGSASDELIEVLGLRVNRLERVAAGSDKKVNSPISMPVRVNGCQNFMVGACLRAILSSGCFEAFAVIVWSPELDTRLSTRKNPRSNSASQSPRWFVTMTKLPSKVHCCSALWNELVSRNVTATESSEQSTLETDSMYSRTTVGWFIERVMLIALLSSAALEL